MAEVFILGAGSFGTSLGITAHSCGNHVTLWAHSERSAARLKADRVHDKLPEGVRIPEDIVITSSLSGVKTADLALIATPSFAVRETAAQLAGILPAGVPVVCAAKGLEDGTLKTMSRLIREELPNNPAVILSGPSHAEEVARGCPTTVVAASVDQQAAEFVQDALMNETFRIYTSDDVLGVELGGAVKNVIALSAGILDGLKLGDNTRAALMTRGIVEIARLGTALGARAETFAGLSGIGDLIVTCSSMHSRNRRCGILIGQGVPVKEAIAQIGMVVEGYPCTKAAWELSQRHHIYMPIVDQAYQVLYGGKPPQDALHDLMDRPKRHETETAWLISKN